MRLRARPGFTLVELMVAVLLIDVALLALVAGTAIVAKRHTELRARELAARVVSNRIQSAIAAGCAPGAVVRSLADSESYAIDGAVHQVVLRTRVAC
jgi:type II secretory pathway pseudopilin PulG